MSETTIESVSFHKKILAVQAASPEAERENVIEFIPGFRFSCFYTQIEHKTFSICTNSQLTNCSDVNLNVFAKCFLSTEGDRDRDCLVSLTDVFCRLFMDGKTIVDASSSILMGAEEEGIMLGRVALRCTFFISSSRPR